MSFGRFVRDANAAGRLVVQPRMGFQSPHHMREGLLATRSAAATTVGTITLDSYTRVGDHDAARLAVEKSLELNGYPLVAHTAEVTRSVLDGVQDAAFPVQVRHGSASPQRILAALAPVGLNASEGGPISYCLPYGRLPIGKSVENWTEGCRLLVAGAPPSDEPHLETFGGCMLGQLCPPSLLVALSVLEGLFFRQHGLHSISLSYAQQTNAEQDTEAVGALRRLAAERLPGIDWHVVIYAYMGLFPQTEHGAAALLRAAACLAVRTRSERLMVKTSAEAFRIPTIDENVTALERAAHAASAAPAADPQRVDTGIYDEARGLVEAVLELTDDVGRALVSAFRLGILDVPYCLHPDNAGRSRAYIDDKGWLRWSETGRMPITADGGGRHPLRAADLLDALGYIRHTFDRQAPEPTPLAERDGGHDGRSN